MQVISYVDVQKHNLNRALCFGLLPLVYKSINNTQTMSTLSAGKVHGPYHTCQCGKVVSLQQYSTLKRYTIDYATLGLYQGITVHLKCYKEPRFIPLNKMSKRRG